MSAILEQKCPCCGGAVEFDSGVQKLKCPYCDTEFEITDMPQETDEINWSSQGSQWSAGETDGMNVYSCNSCGISVISNSVSQ